MSQAHEKKQHIREKGKQALATVLKQEQNIKIIEKYINKTALSLMVSNSGSEQVLDYETLYKKIIYQTIGDIITKELSIKVILENIKNELVDWKHPVFKEIFQRLEEHDDFIINPFEVEEGCTECKKCGSKRVFTYTKQIRSSDEPMTTFAKCVQCKISWTYSG